MIKHNFNISTQHLCSDKCVKACYIKHYMCVYPVIHNIFSLLVDQNNVVCCGVKLFPAFCRSIRHHFKHSVDTSIVPISTSICLIRSGRAFLNLSVRSTASSTCIFSVYEALTSAAQMSGRCWLGTLSNIRWHRMEKGDKQSIIVICQEKTIKPHDQKATR